MKQSLTTVELLTSLLARFPGVGAKSANRMVFYLLKRGKEEVRQFIRVLQEFHDRVGTCQICFNLAEGDRCWICADVGRDPQTLCLVEEPSDVLAIEKAGVFRGIYHVLGGRLSPLDGLGAEALHFASLEARLSQGTIKELILATNPTVEGEATAHYAMRIAAPFVEKITRLAYGLPMGSSLEYADESTLYQALFGRKPYQ